MNGDALMERSEINRQLTISLVRYFHLQFFFKFLKTVFGLHKDKNL